MASFYVIDTSSFIDLAQYYPKKVFPKVWKKLKLLTVEYPKDLQKEEL